MSWCIMISHPRWPPFCIFFDVFGVLHKDAEDLLKRLQGLISQVELAHDDLVWFSVQRRISYTIAGPRALGRKLTARLPDPWWEAKV
jgi:hypothetical protein